MKITVVLPSFNEAADLPHLLARIGSSLNRMALSFRIVVVDDGSTDETASVVKGASARWPVTIVRHSKNLGLGAAIQTAIDQVSDEDDVLIVMDADNTHDPEVIGEMLAQIRAGSDVVIASRFCKGGTSIGLPYYRVVLSRILSAILRGVVRYPNVTDYSSGYRAYRTTILALLKARYGNSCVQERGFACMFELLLRLRAVGANVSEVPLVLRYDLKRGRSKMRILRTISRYPLVFFRFHLAPSYGTTVHATPAVDWQNIRELRKVANS